MLERRDVADDDPNVAGRVLLAQDEDRAIVVREDGARWCARRRARAALERAHGRFLMGLAPRFRERALRGGPLVRVRAPRDAPSSRRQICGPGRSPADRAFLSAVADAVEPARPRARRALSRIDPPPREPPAAGRAGVDRVRVGAEDGGAGGGRRGGWFSVEIKPKCGFAPRDPESTSRFAPSAACAFGEVRRASAYDPLDLFAARRSAEATDDGESTTLAGRRSRARRRAANNSASRGAGFVAAGHDAAVFRASSDLGRVRVSHGWTRDRSRRETGRAACWTP